MPPGCFVRIRPIAQPAALADAQLGRAGQGLAAQGPRAFAGVKAAGNRQAVVQLD